MKLNKSEIWGSLKRSLISHLKGQFIKLIIKKLLGMQAMGGFKVWLVKFIATELFEEVAEPVIELGLRKVGYLYRVHEGERLFERIENAETNSDWRDNASRV